MTAIKRIRGFEKKAQSLSSDANQLTLVEDVSIEAENPSTQIDALVNALPSFASGPGSTEFNPIQATFTLNVSRHPFSNNYYLNKLVSFKRDPEVPEDRFWIITLEYKTQEAATDLSASLLPGFSQAFSPKNRKDQRVTRPDATDISVQEPIDDPLLRPPVFRQTNNAQIIESYFELSTGEKIIHANGIPIRNPVKIPVVNKVLTWTLNLPITTDLTALWAAENTCNDALITLQSKPGSGPTWDVAEGTLKCNSITVAEERESSNGTEYHYLKASIVYEHSKARWDLPTFSHHTLQKQTIEGVTQLVPIDINARGDKAKNPWPLKTDGSAVPFNQLDSTPISERGVLSTLITSIDFLKVPPSNLIASQIATYGLYLPRVRD